MQREVILVVGQTGAGKTHWAREFIKTQTRVIVCEAAFNEFGLRPCESFHQFLQELQKGFFRVSYTPDYWEWPYVFEAVKWCGLNGSPVWLVIEEADRIENPRQMYEYNDIINRGRHYGINLLAISTRPRNLPTDYRAQVTRVLCFRQRLPDDIEYISNLVGEDISEHVVNLPTGCHMDWTSQTGVQIVKASGQKEKSLTGSESLQHDTRFDSKIIVDKNQENNLK